MKTKQCTKCKESKPISAFSKNQYRCKACVKQYREENIDKIKERKAAYYKKNRDAIRAKVKQDRIENGDEIRRKTREYRERNKEKLKIARAKYRKKNRDKINQLKLRDYYKNRDKILSDRRKRYANEESLRNLISERGKKYRESWSKEKREDHKIKRQKYAEDNKAYFKQYRKEYYQKNKEIIKKQTTKYRKANKDHLAKCANERKKRLRKNSPAYKLMESISQHTRIIFRHIKEGKNIRSEETLGCSAQDLVNRFEELFEEGMTWENHGLGDDKWQIDHIVPVSWFIKNMPDRAALANLYWNLQPMWARHNSSKNNKVNQKDIDFFFKKLKEYENK